MAEHNSANSPTALISVTLASGSNDASVVEPVYPSRTRLFLDLLVSNDLRNKLREKDHRHETVNALRD